MALILAMMPRTAGFPALMSSPRPMLLAAWAAVITVPIDRLNRRFFIENSASLCDTGSCRKCAGQRQSQDDCPHFLSSFEDDVEGDEVNARQNHGRNRLICPAMYARLRLDG